MRERRADPTKLGAQCLDATPAEAAAGEAKHRCRLLEGRVCAVNGSIVYRTAEDTGSSSTGWNAAGPKGAQARLPWNSHKLFNVVEHYGQTLHSTRLLAALSSQPLQDTKCHPPLAWVPTWSVNFAEMHLNSIAPLLELELAGLSSSHVRLLPDVLTPFYSKATLSPVGLHACGNATCGETAPPWFSPFVGVLSEKGQVELLHELAPPCTAASDDVACAATATCFSHLRYCRLRSAAFNEAQANGRDDTLPAFTAAQLYARRLYQRHGWDWERTTATARASSHKTEGAPPPPLRVLFLFRGPKDRRSILNLPELVRKCNLAGHVCATIQFGNASSTSARAVGDALAEDVRAVRSADVLIGMHGAGLNHAFYMRGQSALVEIRPYGFEGKWPDRYFREPLALAGSQVYHVHVAVGSASLCRPRVQMYVSTTTARDLSCMIPWSTLALALENIGAWRQPATGDNACPDGSAACGRSYQRSTPAARSLVAYAPAGAAKTAGTAARLGQRERSQMPLGAAQGLVSRASPKTRKLHNGAGV